MTEQKTPRRKASSKAEQRAEMTEQILDSAEFLFSRHGLYGVTLKDVAKHVGVHHTLINYYFDDKKTLFDRVFARRAVVTNERRMRSSTSMNAATASPPSRARCAPSSIPTSISTSKAARDGRTMPHSARRSPTRPNGAPK